MAPDGGRVDHGDHGGHGDHAHEDHGRQGTPTDRTCPGCRVCDCYRTDSATDVDDDADHRAEPHHHGDRPSAESHDHGDMVDHSGHESMFKKRFFVCFVLSIPVLYYSPMLQTWFGYSAISVPGSEFVGPVLGTVVFIYGGVPFLRMGAVEARNREPGMMLLISLAITVAFGYSVAAVLFGIGEPFFWELVTLIVIFLLGHWIEMRSVRRASGALDELAQLLPDTAERLSEDGEPETVPVSALEPGDRVLVRPGANVPADGVVESGESAVNEAMITGESRPVDKEPGDTVIGGTTNRSGSLRVRISATGDETTLSGIMRLVEAAQQSKSRTQVLADRAAGWLFYAAIAVAAVTAVAWTAAVGFGLPVVERVVTVLVIACPHALGLAVPLVVAINTSMAARNGMLIRDRIAMESARNLDTIVFDKTGTLTAGEQGVVDVAATAGWEGDAVLATMAGAERDSEHMIATAVRTAAADRDLELPSVTDFEALEGRGVRVTVTESVGNPAGSGDDSAPSGGAAAAVTAGETAYVGGPNLLRHLDIEPDEHLRLFADRAGDRGQGVVYLIVAGEPVGAVALADVIREESFAAIEALHELDIEVAMLTGDAEAVARSVADELGIETYFAEVLPEDKDEKIVEL